MIVRSGCVAMLCVVQIFVSSLAGLADDLNAKFEMEVQENLFASQISSVREKHGVCTRVEVSYWQQLANLYLSHNMEKKAEQTYYQLLQTCVDQKKIYHPDTLIAAEILSQFYHHQSDLEKADQLNTIILSSSEDELGKEDLELLPVLDYLSRNYQKTGDISKSEEILLRALHIVEESNRSTRLDIAKRQLLLADFYYNQKKSGEAEKFYEKLSPVFFAEHERFDEVVLAIRERMVRLFSNSGKWAQAEPHMHELVAHLMERGGESNPIFIRALGHLSVIYANQGKFDESDATLTRGIALAEKGGDKTSELLGALEKYRSELKQFLKHSAATDIMQCTERQRKLLYEFSMQWNDSLELVRSKAKKLSLQIEEDDQFVRQLKRSNPEYNKTFVRYLGFQHETWGESTLAEICLAELARYEDEIARYLNDGKDLYNRWDRFSSLCVEQGKDELAEQARIFRSHHSDASINVSMLRNELLERLNQDCINRKEIEDEFDILFSDDFEGEETAGSQ